MLLDLVATCFARLTSSSRAAPPPSCNDERPDRSQAPAAIERLGHPAQGLGAPPAGAADGARQPVRSYFTHATLPGRGKSRLGSRSRIPHIAGAVFLVLASNLPLQCQTADSPAAVQLPSLFDPLNSRLPDWIRFSGEFRDRAEGRSAFAFTPDTADGYDLTRLRLNFELTPTEWLSFLVQVQDAEAPGIDSSRLNSTLKDAFDLRLAYAEVNAGPGERYRLRVGRQELDFGARRLVGSSDWSNTAHAFDAVRFTLALSRAQIDVFAAAPVQIHMTAFDTAQPGVNLYGIYASFAKAPRHAAFEPYIFWKTSPRVKPPAGSAGDEDLFALGFRWARTPTSSGRFDYQVEMVRETGHYSTDDIAAWAGYGIAGYRFAEFPFQPRFSLEYDYASGNPRPGGRMTGTFDQLYPAHHAYYGVADQVGWRNIRALRTGVDFETHRNIKMGFDYYLFRLASPYDGLYDCTGFLVVKAPVKGALHTDVGQEADFTLTHEFARNLEWGAGFARLFPGRFLKQYSPGSGVSYPYLFTTYHF